MKKKLTINTLALGNLKRRRKQYIIMIISIILAMVFSSGMLFFMFSSSETSEVQLIEDYGKQTDIMAVDGDEKEIFDKAVEDGILLDYGFAHIIGYGYMNDSEDYLGTAIGWFDDKTKELSNQKFLEGAYPVREDEIAIEQTALMNLDPNAKLGDEMTLKIKIQNGAEYYGLAEKTYKLVGIIKDKKSNQVLHWQEEGSELVPAAFVAQGTQPEAGGKEKQIGYCVSSVTDRNAYLTFNEYLYDLEIEHISCFTSLYFAKPGVFYYSDNLYIIPVIILLVLASCVAIINAFNTNLKERKKQIGMFRAVGATKRQIIKIFGREAFIISLICTPISIVISYFLVWGLINVIYEEAIMTKSIAVLPIAAAVCIVITMLSALIPLKNASRITPMQAIRNIENNRKMRLKKIKSKMSFDVSAHLASRNSRLYKGGKIAVSIILVITILFSALCFSYINYQRFNEDYMVHDYKLPFFFGNEGWGYANVSSNGLTEAERRELDEYPYFSKVSAEKRAIVNLETDEISDYLFCVAGALPETESFTALQIAKKLNYDTLLKDAYGIEADGTVNSPEHDREKEFFNFSKEAVPMGIKSFENDTVKALESKLAEGKIDLEKFSSGEEIILVAPKSATYAAYIHDTMDGGQTFDINVAYNGASVKDGFQVLREGELQYKVGDKLNLSAIHFQYERDYEEYIPSYTKQESEVTIGAIIDPDDVPESLGCDSFSIITTHAGMTEISETARYTCIEMDVAENIEITNEVDEAITSFLTQFVQKYGSWIESNYMIAQSRREDAKSLLATVLSMTIIAFTMCAAIVNNSLAATIREKKKEIGTLRAVGADIKTLVKSYILQLLSMLGIGYGIGFAAFGLGYFAIWIGGTLFMRQYGQVYESEMIFSPWETLIFCVILFAICSINLWSKVRKEMKNSIVENIKEL